MAIESIELKRIPEAPKEMNDVAAQYWRKKCQDLKLLGKLNTTILESLQAYCNHLSDMARARQMMDNAWGQEVFFKYQKAYIEANKQQIALAREFGFTPLSSNKMPAIQKEEEDILSVLNRERVKSIAS
jgi:phage terminase small subunit